MGIFDDTLIEKAKATQDGYHESVAFPAEMFLGRNREYTIEDVEEQWSLKFDLLLSENHKWDVRASTHPVEDGEPFTDHVQKTLRKGDFVGYITNFGLRRGELTTNAAQDVFDFLESYRENVVPVNLVTTLKYYENYIITSVAAKRDGKTGEAQGFMIQFQEFRTVQLSDTDISTTQVKRSDKNGLNAAGKNGKDAKQTSPNANAGTQKPVRFFSSAENSAFETYFNTPQPITP